MPFQRVDKVRFFRVFSAVRHGTAVDPTNYRRTERIYSIPTLNSAISAFKFTAGGRESAGQRATARPAAPVVLPRLERGKLRTFRPPTARPCLVGARPLD